MRLEHHLVGGYVRYISPYIICVIIIYYYYPRTVLGHLLADAAAGAGDAPFHPLIIIEVDPRRRTRVYGVSRLRSHALSSSLRKSMRLVCCSSIPSSRPNSFHWFRVRGCSDSVNSHCFCSLEFGMRVMWARYLICWR